MSRSDYESSLGRALDRFDVPPLRDGFASDLHALATRQNATVPRRRDPRGLWKRGRQAVIGSLAVGMLGAAAVASGLLGAAGIRVPVLTAMLAPEPAPVALVRNAPVRPHRVVRPATETAPVPTPPDVDPLDLRGPVLGADPERRAAFMAAHPRVAAALRERQVQRRTFVASHPDVREAVREVIAERRQARASGVESPPLDRAALRTTIIERAQAIGRDREEIVTLPVLEAAPALSAVASGTDRQAALRDLRSMRARRAAIREFRRSRNH